MQISDGTHSLQARVFFGAEFDEIVGWYMENGVIYSDQTLFVMACKHNRNLLLERNVEKDLDIYDAWYIQYVSGSIKRLFEIMPEELEWVIFERHEGEAPRCYKLNRIRKKLGV
jgi:hypothetical protein